MLHSCCSPMVGYSVVMGAVLSWVAAASGVCGLVLDTAHVLGLWRSQTQEALEGSLHSADGSGPGGEGGPSTSAGPLGGSTARPDSPSWRTRWPSSNPSPDGEDGPAALLRAEDCYSHAGHSRARRRESVIATEEDSNAALENVAQRDCTLPQRHTGSTRATEAGPGHRAFEVNATPSGLDPEPPLPTQCRVKRSSGTINQIGSSITFSAEAEAPGRCAPDLTGSAPRVSQQATAGSTAAPHDTRQRREKRPGRRRRRSRGAKPQSPQVSERTRSSISESSEQEATGGRDEPVSLVEPLEKVQERFALLPEPDSAQTLPDGGGAFWDVLPPLVDTLFGSPDISDSNNNTKARAGGTESAAWSSHRAETCCDRYWSSEDSAVSGLGQDLEDHCPFSLTLVEDLEKHKKPGLPLDKECNNELNNYKESFEDYFLAEKYREPQYSSHGPQQEVNILRDPYSDISLPTIRWLEPILEADRCQGNSVSLCCQHELEEDPSTTAVMKTQFHTPVSEVNDLATSSLLGDSGEQHCRPMTMSYDTTTYGADSNEEDKSNKKGKTKGSQTANKASKFSVFAKMPSFRKAKGVKGSKPEEPSRESTERGEESVPSRTPDSERSFREDNSDEEGVAEGSDTLNQTVQQAFSSRHDEAEEESYGFFPPAPRTRHVQQLCSHGGQGEINGALHPDSPHLRQVQSTDSQAYKRSKSNDSLNNNIRLRFAQAHKSLSSLFESRSMDKENEEHLSSANVGDLSRAKQSWRRLKRAKEAELLRRALSVPEGDTSTTGTEENLEDSTVSSVQDRIGIPSSPISLRALRHTDPLSKRGVPQGDETDIPHGCKSEGQRRKCSAIELPITAHSSSDDSEAPPINEPQSPISPSSWASLSHQRSPTGVPSSPLAGDALTEGPLRPMSPKPNSPRPAAQRRAFRYPQSVRASVLSSVRLGQSISVEGLTDPPGRPRTLKPTASLLGLSLCPLDGPEGSIDQSHTSLHTIGSINELEARPPKLPEAQEKAEAAPHRAPGETRRRPDPDRAGVGPRHRRHCSDDLWMEEEKRYKRKLARAARGSLGQLDDVLSPQDLDRARAGVTLGSLEAIQRIPLRAHCFSQSIPIGLDCLGWRNISYSCE
ncbi:hypothetical protein NHX12_021154 [Muraenolepis orangiensis]|uniref:Uncharacterized protein n=1 Tax=Muraenolepis orangiensis TaxID=630683 RepID=A0A9Q0ERM3_9TELE|nr:hypothetical protein NHX12_021154 [Muraenolepis orangiensis]